MATRKKKFDEAQDYPRVPHFHTCRDCPRRHRYECREPRCVWRVILWCGGVKAHPAPGTKDLGAGV